jgi:hypothetical protein
MKKIFLIGIVSLFLIAIAFTIVTQSGERPVFKGKNISYDKNSEKYIGSEHYVFFKGDIPSIDNLLDRTDLIVIGHAIDSGKTIRLSQNAPEKFKEKYKKTFKKELTSIFTKVNFQIEKVIFGKSNTSSNNIVIRQYGEAGSDIGENKLIKDKRVLLLLEEKSDGAYKVSGIETGAFDVYSDGNIVSHGRDTAIESFDNKNINNLINHISEYKNVKIDNIY